MSGRGIDGTPIRRQRYDSAAALAEELERWLNGGPIIAQAVTVWERAIKWARRKPTIVALGTAVVVVAALEPVIDLSSGICSCYGMNTTRKSYPSDVTDGEWEFLLPYLTLMREDAPQRAHSLRDLFDAIRYVIRTGCQWRFLPHDFPPWTAVYQQARRWLHAGVFEHIAHDLRAIVRFLDDRNLEPSAAILDGRTLQSTPESGDRAGYDGAKKKKGSKIHAAVDTLGNLLALKTTPANEQERAQVSELAKRIQEVTDGNVEIAFVDQGYTGEDAALQAEQEGIRLEVVKHTEAKRGFVLLPRRWVVERTFGWLGRFRRLARDYERLTLTLEGWHWLAAVALLLVSAGFKSA
jgi:transposase